MNNDYCLRGTAYDGQARFFVATSKELVDEARLRHGLSSLATVALGRTLTATAMMGMTLKGKDTLNITFKGDGVLGSVVARADSNGEVKGYVDNPEADLPLKDNGKVDVSGGIGFGMLYISKDLGLKEPYTGSVPIVSGEIGEDITEYYYSSEQTLSAVGLGVLIDVDYSVKSSGGFIIQLMPDADEEIGRILDEKVQKLPSLSGYFIENKPEDFVELLFDGNFNILESKKLSFKCHCSKDNFSKALASLGLEELKKLGEDNEVEVICQFCNNKYVFDKNEINNIIELLS